MLQLMLLITHKIYDRGMVFNKLFFLNANENAFKYLCCHVVDE